MVNPWNIWSLNVGSGFKSDDQKQIGNSTAHAHLLVYLLSLPAARMAKLYMYARHE